MADERRHESADLEDYEVLDGSDTLCGAPGDDPLDRGVVTPDRWSAAMRFGSTAAEQQAGEALDQLLAEEEPDPRFDLDDPRPEEDDWDENATQEEIGRLLLDGSPDPRTGRLVAPVDGTRRVDDVLAYDTGIDGGGATAEEAAVHLVINADADSGSGTGS
jgi:hypothetical protein